MIMISTKINKNHKSFQFANYKQEKELREEEEMLSNDVMSQQLPLTHQVISVIL